MLVHIENTFMYLNEREVFLPERHSDTFNIWKFVKDMNICVLYNFRWIWAMWELTISMHVSSMWNTLGHWVLWSQNRYFSLKVLFTTFVVHIFKCSDIYHHSEGEFLVFQEGGNSKIPHSFIVLGIARIHKIYFLSVKVVVMLYILTTYRHPQLIHAHSCWARFDKIIRIYKSCEIEFLKSSLNFAAF